MLNLAINVELKLSFIGCAANAPDGNSPGGYVRVLATDHRLKILRSPEDLLDSGLLFLANPMLFLSDHDVIDDDDGMLEYF
jgi:hypothetical protein